MAKKERQVVKSFAELKQLLQQSTDVDAEVFRKLPIRERLNQVYDSRISDPQNSVTLLKTSTVVRDALEMDPQEREALGVNLITMVPLDGLGNLLVSPDVFSYQVFFMFENNDGIERLLTFSRTRIGNFYEEDRHVFPSQDTLDKIDSLVASNVTLRPELSFEQSNRLVQEVKLTDSLIKEQKKIAQVSFNWSPQGGRKYRVDNTRSPINQTMEYYNDVKHDRLSSYVLACLTVQEEFPHLGPLYTLTRSEDYGNYHRAIEMRRLYDLNLRSRLRDVTVPPHLIIHDRRYITNINLGSIASRRQRAALGNGIALDLRIAEMAEILGL